MSEQTPHLVLLYVGLIHALGSFGLFALTVDAPMGVLSLNPLIWAVFVPALLVVGAVIARLLGARLHWTALLAFVVWEVAVGVVQLTIFAAASAAV